MKRIFYSEESRPGGLAAATPEEAAVGGAGFAELETDSNKGAGSAGGIIASRSARMRRVIDRARQLGFDHRSVLVEGERGAGKSLLTRMMHDAEPLEGGGYVTLECKGISPEKLMRGMKRAADVVYERGGGASTIVLEDVDHLPSAMLNDLVQALVWRPQLLFGAELDGARLIGTTRTETSALLQSRGLSEDLAARLRRLGAVVTVPPLRERREDIVVMGERFLRKQAEEDGREELKLALPARQALTAYHWPGNVRELRSIVERAAVVARNATVDVADLALPLASDAAPLWPEGRPSLDALERMYILRVIRECATLEEAAAILKVDITTLWRKRRRYGI
ncbi:MAG TPA: sigma 54-interacting transcriptional regulator [Phycisphaerae bacterium]|nr:sigma 54-interacting transcriptional regulator [Phycisphaerae bacterium]